MKKTSTTGASTRGVLGADLVVDLRPDRDSVDSLAGMSLPPRDRVCRNLALLVVRMQYSPAVGSDDRVPPLGEGWPAGGAPRSAARTGVLPADCPGPETG